MKKLPLDHYLESLASADSAPGGGAAAALTAAQGAALLAMSLRLSDHEASPLLKELDGARRRLLELAEADGLAFAKVLAAYKLPTDTPEHKAKRRDEIQTGLRGAADVPLAVMRAADALFSTATQVAALAKPTVISDTGIAVELLAAAQRCSRYNVEINLKYLKDDAFVAATAKELKALLAAAKQQRKELGSAIRKSLKS